MLDLLLCVPTYRSAHAAIRMIESLHYIDANILCFITGVDVQPIADYLQGKDVPVILAQSNRNCTAFNQAWGFVWAMNNGLKAEYVCFIDDDVEFTENSRDIVQTIKAAEPFSVLSLASSVLTPTGLHARDNGVLVDIHCLDECGIFVSFENCRQYGVRDSQPQATWIFYTGVEYLHRLRYLTGVLSVADVSRVHYLHHQRTDVEINAVRTETEGDAWHYSSFFWKDKFGISLSIDPIGNPKIWNELWELCSEKHSGEFRKHLVFDGRWVEWGEIYDAYCAGVEIVHEEM